MASLVRAIGSEGSSPGFLLPVFSLYKGANRDVVQSIVNDRIVSFNTLSYNSSVFAYRTEDIDINEGDSALWIYRDPQGDLIYGNRMQLESALTSLLLVDFFAHEFPLAACELVSFLAVEEKFATILQKGFRFMGKQSPEAAAVWRDCVFLLPAVKKDIVSDRSAANLKGLEDILVVSEGSSSTIYIPGNLAKDIDILPQFSTIAAIFGIEQFNVRVFEENKRSELQGDRWEIVGIGGNARYVLNNSSFKLFEKRSEGAITKASGSVRNLLRSIPAKSADAANFFAAIFLSNLADTSKLDSTFSRETGFRHKHAINIRPLGYSKSGRNISPRRVREVLRSFEFFWIITTHRQQHTGSFANDLSATQIASQACKAAVLGLIDMQTSEAGLKVLNYLASERPFGLVGSTGYDRKLSKETVVARCLYRMINLEAELSTAHRIIVLWPDVVLPSERFFEIHIASKAYSCDCYSSKIGAAANSVIALACGVKLMDASSKSLSEFLVSILWGYGFTLLRDTHGVLLFGKESTSFELKACATIRDLAAAIDNPSVANLALIVQDRIGKQLSETARRRGHTVIHYSALTLWLRQTFGLSSLAISNGIFSL